MMTPGITKQYNHLAIKINDLGANQLCNISE